MGVTTSFFAATFDELAAAAPGWVKPTYGAFSKKEAVNPFTSWTYSISFLRPRFEISEARGVSFPGPR